jgi:hypothetical protein
MEVEATTPTDQPVEDKAVVADDVSGDSLVTPDESAAQPETDAEHTSEPAVDMVEVERDGVTYQIPKALQDELLMRSDYSRKMHEVGEQRREVDRQRAQLQQASEEERSDYAQLWAMDQQIQQFQNADWDKLIQENPQQAQQFQLQLNKLRDQRAQFAQGAQQRAQQRALDQTQAMDKLVEQGHAALSKDIDGWGEDRMNQVHDFAVSGEIGFSPADLEGVFDPRVVKLMHWAEIGHRMTQEAQAAAKKVESPEPAPETKKPKGRPAARKTMNEMNIDEWMEARNKQLYG